MWYLQGLWMVGIMWALVARQHAEAASLAWDLGWASGGDSSGGEDTLRHRGLQRGAAWTCGGEP